jgi:uncharacterized protein
MSVCYRPRLSPLLLTVLFFGIASLAMADDWVLTDRFKSQLKVAQSGDALAMYEIGRMYERGRGTDQNVAKAVEWYKKASEKGQHEAKARLGILFLEGNGVARNVTSAAELLAAAADAGVATAQFYLATMFENGEGLAQDEQKALRWYKAAAEGGYYQAKARIAALSTKPVAPRKPVAKHSNKPAATQAITEAPVVAASAEPSGRQQSGEALLRTIMEGKWINKDAPAAYLPSRTTLCETTGEQSLKCVSGEQTRNTGSAVISYVLEAELSGFNASDQFTVQYVNNVLGTKSITNKSAEDGQRLAFNVKTGKQGTVHRLNCELEEENKLVCIKDRITTITFTR